MFRSDLKNIFSSASVQVCQQGPDRGADAGEHLHLHPRDREDPVPCPPDPVSPRLVLQEPVQVAQEGVQDHPANTLPIGPLGQGKNENSLI